MKRREAISYLSAFPATVRLITPDVAVERIESLLANEDVEVRQRLVSIAGVAIAAVMSLDGEAIEFEEIDGLEESVNSSLFV